MGLRGSLMKDPGQFRSAASNAGKLRRWPQFGGGAQVLLSLRSLLGQQPLFFWVMAQPVGPAMIKPV
jgi:hypothetical protein